MRKRSGEERSEGVRRRGVRKRGGWGVGWWGGVVRVRVHDACVCAVWVRVPRRLIIVKITLIMN